MSTCVHGLVAHVCCKPWFTATEQAAIDAVIIADLPAFVVADLAAAPLPRPPCAHVFLGPFDVCLSCGTPNPATLR